jgi:hypothetical protein
MRNERKTTFPNVSFAAAFKRSGVKEMSSVVDKTDTKSEVVQVTSTATEKKITT